MPRRTRRRRRSGRTRRRYGRRRFRRGMRRSGATTSQWGRPFTTTYRGRRTARRSFRSAIFNATKFKAHYRSTFESSAVITTPSNVETGRLRVQRALFNSAARGGGVPFWVAAGGAIPIDGVTPVPSFEDDIILRGGIARVEIYNGDVECARVEVMSVWSNAHPKDLFATDSDVPLEWDPSLKSEFSQFGKLLTRKIQFLPPKQSMLVTHVFKPQKLGQEEFIGVDGITADVPSANTLFWFIKVVSCAVGNFNLIWKTSFSVSFSGDASSVF